MDYVAANFADISHIVTVPADTPFVPRDLVKRLRDAREEAAADIAVARSGERDHHSIALWPVALRGALRHALVEEELRKVGGFIERFRSVAVEWPTEPHDPFFNINRPEDVALAEAMAAQT
jgi:molybdopterin-guanine dinucleotide biosynthesis protein A